MLSKQDVEKKAINEPAKAQAQATAKNGNARKSWTLSPIPIDQFCHLPFALCRLVCLVRVRVRVRVRGGERARLRLGQTTHTGGFWIDHAPLACSLAVWNEGRKRARLVPTYSGTREKMSIKVRALFRPPPLR